MPNLKVDQNSNEVHPINYKVYTAFLQQSGTDAPVATVVENTIGSNIVWTRDTLGNYNSVNNAFTANKTVVPPFHGGVSMPLYSSLPADYFYSVDTNVQNTVSIQIFDTAGDSVEWSTTGCGIFVEIRVYP